MRFNGREAAIATSSMAGGRSASRIPLGQDLQDMCQPLQRLKAFSPSCRSSGAAPEVDQAPEICPPQQPARDRGTAGHADPVLEAGNGAAVDATKRPLRLLVVAQDSTMRRQMIDYLESHDMRATSAAIRPETLRHLA